jgi:glycosyltransferase involved in cell wall biosynthesis
MKPLISICIPTYKQPYLLKRTFESIQQQTYKNVEIVVSDDSPDNSVQDLCTSFQSSIPIHYFKNEKALGSPANWNKALGKAEGAFIVLLHHDDCFLRTDALERYITIFSKEPRIDGIFSRNNPIDEQGMPIPTNYESRLINSLQKYPDFLIRSNQIGPPSNLIIAARVVQLYNEKYLWLVDVEYYIRLLKGGANFYFLNERLMHIGIHKDQITEFCYRHPEIIVRENIWLARQVDRKAWRDVKFYDHYWRLLRNNMIRNKMQLLEMGLTEEQLPPVILRMIRFQQKLPPTLLRNGIFSKMGMGLSYLLSRLT